MEQSFEPMEAGNENRKQTSYLVVIFQKFIQMLFSDSHFLPHVGKAGMSHGVYNFIFGR